MQYLCQPKSRMPKLRKAHVQHAAHMRMDMNSVHVRCLGTFQVLVKFIDQRSAGAGSGVECYCLTSTTYNFNWSGCIICNLMRTLGDQRETVPH